MRGPKYIQYDVKRSPQNDPKPFMKKTAKTSENQATTHWEEGTYTETPMSNPSAHDGQYTVAFIQPEHMSSPEKWPRVVPSD